jgi:hypothetical protein
MRDLRLALQEFERKTGAMCRTKRVKSTQEGMNEWKKRKKENE